MGNFAKQFEELTIWQSARKLVPKVYCELNQNNDFGFRDQIQRAAVSAMTNIAEGFERRSAADFARFLDIAKGSSGEVRSLLYVAEDLYYIEAKTAEQLRADYESLSKGIAALARSIRQ
jgi:four helix bundle protein